MRVWPGGPLPLGATWDGEGVNFSLFSEHAEGVQLLLFDEETSSRTLHDDHLEREDRQHLARLSSRRAAGAFTATASKALTNPSGGTVSIPTSS